MLPFSELWVLPHQLSFVVRLILLRFFPFPAFGAAYGTAKSGAGICSMGVMRPESIMKSLVPVVMAGIVAIYGLVVSVVVASKGENMKSIEL